jgi:translation elongation factor EF-G
MVNTEKIVRHALQEGVKITLVVNKLDRLILELRIKPADAYYKVKHTIEEVNTLIRYVSHFAPKFFGCQPPFLVLSIPILPWGWVRRTAM